MSISVVIIKYDQGEYLDKVINSVKGFDEVLVCDMDSVDETLNKAKSDWIFVLEHDEIVPSALRQYLYRYIKKKNCAEALYIPRRNFILDRFRTAKYPDYQLRFFRYGTVNWSPFVNTDPEVDGVISKIPANKKELALIHLPHKISYQLDHLNHFTTAEVNKNVRKKVSLPGMIARPWISFFNSYILRGGFTYGIPGFIAASHDAIYKFYRDAKVYESTLKSKWPAEIDLDTEEDVKGE